MLFSQLRCRGQKEPPARICGLRAGRRLCPGTDSTAPLFRDRVVLRKRGQSGQRIGVSPVLTSTVSPRRGVSRRKPRKSFEVSRVAATSSAVGRSSPKRPAWRSYVRRIVPHRPRQRTSPVSWDSRDNTSAATELPDGMAPSYHKILEPPITVLMDATTHIQDQNLNFQINFDRRDELGQICTALEKMRQTYMRITVSSGVCWRNAAHCRRL